MKIYYTYTYNEKRAESHRLLKQAIAMHTGDAEKAGAMLEGMKKGPMGKPYIDGFSSFSISHSGSVWAVLIADKECGLDVQFSKSCKIKGMAERAFDPADAAAVVSADEDSNEAQELFFRIWTRREALAKAMGGSAFDSSLPSVAGDKVTVKGKIYTVRDIELPEPSGFLEDSEHPNDTEHPGLFAAVCLEGDAREDEWCIICQKLPDDTPDQPADTAAPDEAGQRV